LIGFGHPQKHSISYGNVLLLLLPWYYMSPAFWKKGSNRTNQIVWKSPATEYSSGAEIQGAGSLAFSNFYSESLTKGIFSRTGPGTF